MLALLQAFGELENTTLSVLAPNIRDTFHVTDGVIVFVTAASGAFLALGALPMGWLADRFRRAPVIGWATAAFSVMVFACGLAANAFALFVARFGAGFAKSNTYPVQGSLVADSYPIAVRGRVNATVGGAARVGAVLSPAIAGGIAALAGGTAGWRWAFFVLALPTIPLAFFAFRIPEPRRGQHEMLDVVGEVPEDRAIPISMGAAFARLNRIRTFRTMLLGIRGSGLRCVHGARAAESLPRPPLPRRDVRARGLRHGDRRRCAHRAAVRGEALRRAVPPRPGAGAADDRAC